MGEWGTWIQDAVTDLLVSLKVIADAAERIAKALETDAEA